jgi:SAM-dependent methyltransferase
MYYSRNVLEHSIFDLIDKSEQFDTDNSHYKALRANINTFISKTISQHSAHTILEVGPKRNKIDRIQSTDNTIETVDIVSDNDTTYVADLTTENILPKHYFDAIYCLEVLEHTYEPWTVLKELYSLLKEGGKLYLSFPFQFRIHGPLPDNYRISEFGIRYLLEKYKFKIIAFDALIDSSRPAFPVHYTIACIK